MVCFKEVLRNYLIRFLLAGLLVSTVFAYSGGSGEPDNPYQIGNVSDWQQLMDTSSHWSRYFIMIADVNLQGVTLTPVGNSTTKFTGIFDGNNHIISNAIINQPSGNNVGLFGYVGENGKINKLGVEDANIIGNNYVGVLTGYKYKGIISDCYVSGRVLGQDNVGGLAGYNYGGVTNATILNCYVHGTASGRYYVGGLIGFNSNGIISDCYATGRVNGAYYVGGLVGYNYNVGVIADCYARNDVNGFSDVGGVTGCNSSGVILECYSTGAISGSSNVGGLLGAGSSSGVIASFWNTETSGQATSAGGTGAMGRTTAEMQDVNTYLNAGWDFVNELENGTNEIWQMPDEADYPHLRWEYPKRYYSGGAGTEADPYQISTVFDWLQLMKSSEDWSKHFLMTADVNLAELSLVPIGREIMINPPPQRPFPGVVYSTIIEFAGVFDGGGHIISNVIMSMPDSNYVGLFGITDVNSRICNLELKDVNIITGTTPFSGDSFVGGLIGYNGSTIFNCYVNGAVSGREYIGGLAGYNTGTISKCDVNGVVSGYGYVGGLTGDSEYGIISNCRISGYVSGHSSVGGLCGSNNWRCIISKSCSNALVEGCEIIGGLAGSNSSTISKCHYNGQVSGVKYVGGLVGQNRGEIAECNSAGTVYSSAGTSPNYDSYAGGLVGYNYNGTILTSYADGSATGGGRYVGGLVGRSSSGTISNCYATGAVSCSSDYVGGLIGDNGSTVSKCYSTGAVSGRNYVGGFAGVSPSTIADSFWDIDTSGKTTSSGGLDVRGKTTARMKTRSMFTERGTNWDFVNVWNMGDGQTYPCLRRQILGDLNYDGEVNFIDCGLFAENWLEVY